MLSLWRFVVDSCLLSLTCVGADRPNLIFIMADDQANKSRISVENHSRHARFAIDRGFPDLWRSRQIPGVFGIVTNYDRSVAKQILFRITCEPKHQCV